MDIVAMPQLGETVTEGTITLWSKAVGDPVEVDDALFEVSTEKVDTEVPSAVAGFLRAILVAEGDTVAVGIPVAVITATADEEVDLDSVGAAGSGRSTSMGHGDGDGDSDSDGDNVGDGDGGGNVGGRRGDGGGGRRSSGHDDLSAHATDGSYGGPPGQSPSGGSLAGSSRSGVRSSSSRSPSAGTRSSSTTPSRQQGTGSGAGTPLSPVVRRLLD
ncbi:MAG: lipoyl domain-containing protein, partial [Aquihabitans sp.]